MELVIDGFGGDNAPRSVVGGSITAVNLIKDLKITLTGDKDKLQSELDFFGYKGDKINILHAPEVISNNESPTLAIRQKKDSSLVVGLDYAISKLEDPEFAGFISGGSTGAVLTGALLKIGRIKGIKRPALAPVFPNLKDGNTLLIDCGANMDSKPEFLEQFALMGSLYMKTMYGIENPRVALLNVGVEDKKGNELTHSAFELLKNNKDINFVGNMEARDMFSGDFDVVVTDGFAGNVLLKSCEGTALFILKSLKKEIKSSGLLTKLGAGLIKKPINRLKKKIDFNAIGGSPFLGVKCPVVKAHGSSDQVSIFGAINLALKIYKAKFVPEFTQELQNYDLGE